MRRRESYFDSAEEGRNDINTPKKLGGEKGKKMNTKIAFKMGIVLAVLVMFTASASATTYYVCAETGNNNNDGSSANPWLTIQYAVNDDTVTEGDTIIVRNGTYEENVNVNMDERVTIKAEYKYNATVNASDSGDHVFDVTKDWVNISGFRVTNASTGAGTAGIYLAPTTDHCNISYNNATDNYVGIRLNKSSYNNISHNNASGNDGGSGIGVGKKSNYNTVDNNTVTYNDKNGIGVGILSNYTTIRDNTASNNVDFGIYVNTSSNYTTIRNNTIQDNTEYGVKIRNSYNCNIYYNNFIDNNNEQCQAWDNKDNTVNNWDDGSLGNYWDDHTSPDNNFDGIVDTPYSIDGGASQQDEKPSVTQF